MSKIFLNEKVILFAIILNTLSMYVGGLYTDASWPFYLDILFTLFFLVEALIKILHLGWKNYWSVGWNRFDFIILCISLPSLSELFVDMPVSTNALFALRALRVFKSFKLFRFVPNIEEIFKGIRLAMKSSLLVCIAYMVFLIVFSILTYSLFGQYAPQYFGNPVISMYSIFRLFTIEGWYDMPEAIVESGGFWLGTMARIYFAILLFAGGIIGMSLVNSIFVDAMAADNNDEVLKKLEKIEEEIHNLNRNNNGF